MSDRDDMKQRLDAMITIFQQEIKYGETQIDAIREKLQELIEQRDALENEKLTAGLEAEGKRPNPAKVESEGSSPSEVAPVAIQGPPSTVFMPVEILGPSQSTNNYINPSAITFMCHIVEDSKTQTMIWLNSGARFFLKEEMLEKILNLAPVAKSPVPDAFHSAWDDTKNDEDENLEPA